MCGIAGFALLQLLSWTRCIGAKETLWETVGNETWLFYSLSQQKSKLANIMTDTKAATSVQESSMVFWTFLAWYGLFTVLMQIRALCSWINTKCSSLLGSKSTVENDGPFEDTDEPPKWKGRLVAKVFADPASVRSCGTETEGDRTAIPEITPQPPVVRSVIPNVMRGMFPTFASGKVYFSKHGTHAHVRRDCRTIVHSEKVAEFDICLCCNGGGQKKKPRQD